MFGAIKKIAGYAYSAMTNYYFWKGLYHNTSMAICQGLLGDSYEAEGFCLDWHRTISGALISAGATTYYIGYSLFERQQYKNYKARAAAGSLDQLSDEAINAFNTGVGCQRVYFGWIGSANIKEAWTHYKDYLAGYTASKYRDQALIDRVGESSTPTKKILFR